MTKIHTIINKDPYSVGDSVKGDILRNKLLSIKAACYLVRWYQNNLKGEERDERIKHTRQFINKLIDDYNDFYILKYS